MTSPSFDPKISVGNILVLLAMLVSTGVAWGAARMEISAIRDQQAAQAARLADLYQRLEQSARDRAVSLGAHDARIRNLESTGARQDARLDAILQVVTRIEARIDRMEGNGR